LGLPACKPLSETEVERASFAAFVEITDAEGAVIYSGEAIYRPAKAHPMTGELSPTVGVPDDSMAVRPSGLNTYAVSLSGERVPAAAVYLERVSTCWWFVLERTPEHPPTV
jgi:hypothetical protein